MRFTDFANNVISTRQGLNETRTHIRLITSERRRFQSFYLQHIGGCTTSDRNVIGLVQQIIGRIRFVQMGDQFRLQIVLDKVHQEMHDRFGHRVLNRFTDDVEIRFDKAFCENKINEIIIGTLLIGQYAIFSASYQ